MIINRKLRLHQCRYYDSNFPAACAQNCDYINRVSVWCEQLLLTGLTPSCTVLFLPNKTPEGFQHSTYTQKIIQKGCIIHLYCSYTSLPPLILSTHTHIDRNSSSLDVNLHHFQWLDWSEWSNSAYAHAWHQEVRNTIACLSLRRQKHYLCLDVV